MSVKDWSRPVFAVLGPQRTGAVSVFTKIGQKTGPDRTGPLNTTQHTPIRASNTQRTPSRANNTQRTPIHANNTQCTPFMPTTRTAPPFVPTTPLDPAFATAERFWSQATQ